MSKKLLSEAVMRRFAKLANLEPVNEMYGGNKGDRSAKKDYMQEDAMADIEDEVDSALPPGEEVEMAPGEEEISDEPAMEDGDMDLGTREGMAMDVISAVADALNIEVDIEGGETDDMDIDGAEDMEMGGVEDMEMGGLEGEETEDVEEEEEMMMEALRGINYVPGKKEIINEVAKRVAKRLLKAKKAEHQLQEALGNKKSQRKPVRGKTTAAKVQKTKAVTRASRRRTKK